MLKYLTSQNKNTRITKMRYSFFLNFTPQCFHACFISFVYVIK
ncbi:unnamed protein product [Brugia timori]|uniref:Uncharacterized protein n=1 Tax=Brugia timori TaxID=42155 RepID=A0A3P7W420_9BILA|nr:unnamed protein product [Brugia timori]